MNKEEFCTAVRKYIWEEVAKSATLKMECNDLNITTVDDLLSNLDLIIGTEYGINTYTELNKFIRKNLEYVASIRGDISNEEDYIDLTITYNGLNIVGFRTSVKTLNRELFIKSAYQISYGLMLNDLNPGQYQKVIDGEPGYRECMKYNLTKMSSFEQIYSHYALAAAVMGESLINKALATVSDKTLNDLKELAEKKQYQFNP